MISLRNTFLSYNTEAHVINDLLKKKNDSRDGLLQMYRTYYICTRISSSLSIYLAVGKQLFMHYCHFLKQRMDHMDTCNGSK